MIGQIEKMRCLEGVLEGVKMIKRFLILAILVIITIVVIAAVLGGALVAGGEAAQRVEASGAVTPVTVMIVFVVLGINSFLGVDILKMIKMTKILPPGKYERIKYWRYLVSAAVLVVIGLTTILSGYWQAGYLCITGFIIIGFLVISGLTYNKAVTT